MLNKYVNKIVLLNRPTKWLILSLLDIIVVISAILIAYSLRYGQIASVELIKAIWPLFPILSVTAIAINWFLGITKTKLQSFDASTSQRFILSAIGLSIMAICMCFLFRIPSPRSVPVIFGAIYYLMSWMIRVNVQLLINEIISPSKARALVGIYGAGPAGIQLASSLKNSNEVRLVAYFDTNKLRQKMTLFGLSVYDPKILESVVKQKKINQILITDPDISKEAREVILEQTTPHNCAVRMAPSHVDVIHGKSFLNTLETVYPDDLLMRDKFDVSLPDIQALYSNKTVLISGAGGSIGSEICRQVMKFNPKRIVLYERSEPSLYLIDQELRTAVKDLDVELVTILGCVCDEKFVTQAIKEYKVDVIFHAAAYKHVPLVEGNQLAGLQNNVIGTKVLGDAALKAGVERFILISTDKAVRPSNIMGSTKRMAELIVQDLNNKSDKTIFSMVRFGNVLGSSGSVIPLFTRQINKGGPVTLTHPEVTRYFMAVSEAAYLVIVAGTFAKGGDVFVLDMGEPVKIYDLARRLIRKRGYSIKNADNPNGDMEIIVTGLRPGEKLYEELLIDADALETPHPKILRAQEKHLPPQDIEKMMIRIKKTIRTKDLEAVKAIISDYVPGYQPFEASSSSVA